MCSIEGSNCFEFEQNALIDQHICCKVSNLLTAKPDRNLDLTCDLKSRSS